MNRELILKNDVEISFSSASLAVTGNRRLRLEALLPLSRRISTTSGSSRFGLLLGASTRKHPAPYPLELASGSFACSLFVGDTVLDPFAGTGTTNLAAREWDAQHCSRI